MIKKIMESSLGTNEFIILEKNKSSNLNFYSEKIKLDLL